MEYGDDLPLVYLKYAIKPCSVSITKSDSLISQPDMSCRIGIPELSQALENVSKGRTKLADTVVNKQMLRLAQVGGRSGIYDDDDDDDDGGGGGGGDDDKDPQDMVNECAQCGFKSSTLKDHLKHVNSHDPLYCILCDKHFDKESEMEYHRQSAHSPISCANIIQVDDAVNASEHLVTLFMTRDYSPKKDKESAAIALECSNFQRIAVKDLLSEEESTEDASVKLTTSSLPTSSDAISSTSEVSEEESKAQMEKNIKETSGIKVEDKFEVSSNKEDTKVLKDESDSGTDNKTVETAGSEIEDKDDGTSNKEQETRVIEDESNTGTEKKIEGTGRSEIEDKYEVSSNKEDTKVLKDESDTTTENKTVETLGSEIMDTHDRTSNKEQETRVIEDESNTGTEKKIEGTGPKRK